MLRALPLLAIASMNGKASQTRSLTPDLALHGGGEGSAVETAMRALQGGRSTERCGVPK